MLNSIIVTDLERISVSGGDVLHAMRTDSPGYKGYGNRIFQ